MFQNQISKITKNPIGSVVGGFAGFYAVKKFGKVSNVWLLAGATVVGVALGANVQGMISASASKPTASTTK